MAICDGDARGHHYNIGCLESAGMGLEVVLREGWDDLGLIHLGDCYILL